MDSEMMRVISDKTNAMDQAVAGRGYREKNMIFIALTSEWGSELCEGAS